MTLAISDYYRQHSTEQSGNSFTTLSEQSLIDLVKSNWDKRLPGTGEGDCIDRKVLVPVEGPEFFLPSYVPLQFGMQLHSKVVCRQSGEDPYIETFITPEEAAKFGCNSRHPSNTTYVVCYSKDALLENNGKRSSDADWEIVTLLCQSCKFELMAPLTMARNFLQLPGGTYGDYSAEDFANSIYYYSCRKGVKVKSNV